MNKKFRVWDGKRFLFNYIAIRDNKAILTYPSESGEYSFIEIENAVVQQFTGLKDSKGIDIYEGDIIRFFTKFELGDYESYIEEVYYDEKYAMFCFGRESGFSMLDSGLVRSSLVVVGNIFQK